MNEEFIVSILEDENDGDFSAGDVSLREAIALANEQEGEDNISFNSDLSGGTIALTETEPDPRGAGTVNRELSITDSVKINGLGADALTIDGVNGGNGIFRIEENIDVTLKGLTIANGNRQQFFFQNPTAGGAVVVENGANLTLEDSAILNSVADSAGAISSDGNVEIIRSLIANNESGGGALPEGAVVNGGELNIINSTVAANTGIGVTSLGTSEITNSTITDGINLINPDSTTITSSIVSRNNTATNAASITNNFSQGVTSGGNNLIGNGGDLPGYIDSDLVGTADNPIDPQLGELQDNGGATQAIALQDGSPAIDAGSNPNNLETDGRGAGFDRTVGEGTDIGAFEVQQGNNGGNPVELIVSILEDENDGDFSAGDLSLREAIAQANEQAGADTITFDSDLTGGTITLALGELAIDKNLTIQGLGAENITIDANRPDNVFTSGDISRVFNIDDGNSDIQSEVVINDLTITGGSASEGLDRIASGAGILNRENLEINDSIIRNNNAVNGGGGIFSDATLTVNNSAIYNNDAGRASGGGINNAGTATINQSTIAGNADGGIRGGDGGGIGNTGTLTVSNSTVTGNGSSGIANNGGEITLTSTIVAGNFDNNDLENDDIISGGNNLIGGEATLSSLIGSVGGLANIQDSDLVGTADSPIDPLLGELQDNGGTTPTFALLDGSPAINAGSNPNNLETDQRGEGFDRTVGGSTDIGAFEVQDGGANPIELVVSTTEDENDGDFSQGDLSLREAIALANEQAGADTITFDSSLSGGTINFNNPLERDLIIDDSLSIIGLGQENLTLNGDFILTPQADVELAVDGLNIIGGKIDSFGDLSFTDSSISQSRTGSDNSSITGRGTTIISDSTISDSNGGSNVGILIESGTAIIKNSTVSDHRADQSNSGVIIDSDATVDIINSTIANNLGRAGSGVLAFGTVNITNSTVANNSGGLLAGGVVANGTATVTSSILANNTGTGDGRLIGDISGDGEFISGGNNLISNGDDATGFVDSDIVGTTDNPIDAQLGELQDNGGSTPTLALLDGSPAIDAGNNPNNLETDQRGEGFERTVGGGTDIGAFEVQDGGGNPVELIVSTTEDENDGDFSQGDLSLREAIALANEQAGADTITFDSSLSGSTIAFNQSLDRELIIDDSVAINGLGQDNLTLNGGFIFNIAQADNEVTIDSLNLVGGKIDSFGDLTLTNSTISQTIETGSDNSSVIGRGTTIISDSTISDSNGGSNVGILIESGTAIIKNSTVSDHRADQSNSGVIIDSDATVDIINSTIANNLGRAGSGVLAFGTVNITNSTVANNSGGLLAGGVVADGTATVTSSILANNTGTGDGRLIGDISGDGEFISGGNNLISNGDDATGFVDSDIAGTTDNPIDAQLGELQDNGGSTPTLALLDGSPAIDAGSNPNNLETDGRGEGFDRTVGDGTDIGAFEVQEVDNNLPPGTNGDDRIDGSSEDDLILGLDGSDSLNGNDGADTILGGAGDDLISGGLGNDLLDGSGGDDDISGDRGRDTLIGGQGGDTLNGNGGNDNILGGIDNDSLLGGQGSDTLNGEAGNDFLNGEDGFDLLVGGAGDDTLVGGRGRDIFFLDSVSTDTIVDFVDGRDRLQLSEQLSFAQIGIGDNESNTGALIQDTSNNNFVIALVENINAADLTIDDFA